MSGKMGSGASHILEGIKRKPAEVKRDESIPENVNDLHEPPGTLQLQRKIPAHGESIPVEPHKVYVKQFETFNVNVLHDAMDLALNKKQRISIWAPDIALIMWYLKLSTPMFSISDVAKKYIAEGLMRDYPELYRRTKEELDKSR
jgi:hypothetical protein